MWKVVIPMKKFIIIFSVFFFLSFTINTPKVFAEAKTFTQGIYSIKDTTLLTGINYNVRNTCPTNKSLLLVIDSNQLIQQMLRLEPTSPKFRLKPLNPDDIIIIIGAAGVEIS